MAASDMPPVTAADQVEIEVVAWITKFVGGDGSTRKMYHEPLQDGDTVRRVLRRLSGRFPPLHKALWDPATGDLAEHIEVLVNDAVLDLTHTLESPLHTGDRLALIGQYLEGVGTVPPGMQRAELGSSDSSFPPAALTVVAAGFILLRR